MDDLSELSASALSARIGRGEVSCAEVMAATLDRIDRVNPGLTAIVSLRDRDVLMAEARAADAQHRKGWLHGLPIAIKDLATTRDAVTTWGSPLFAGFRPGQDALLVRRLKAAGAIVIGKTNAPEFGLGSHTFNPVFGPTRNPWDRTRTPGGSSGGAAAALAARLVSLADGSDMMGSLRNPAAFCNVYGFRPSWGQVPSDPEGDTFLHQLSTDGPMARTVEDLARLLETLAGPDPRVPHSAPWTPFSSELDENVSGSRIGWLGDWGGAYPMEPGILELCETGLQRFEEIGCRVERVPPPFPARDLWESWTVLRSWAIAARLSPLWEDPAKRPLLKPEAIWEIERGRSFSAMEVHRASVIRSHWFTTVAGLFENYDALALPAAQVWPFPVDLRHPQRIEDLTMDTYHRWMEVVVPVSLAGLPCLAMPAGFGDAQSGGAGLPMGMQLFGPRGSDRAILRLGQAWHRATDWPSRRPPDL